MRQIHVGPEDIANMRAQYPQIPADAHTLALGRTDVPGLEGLDFPGASPELRAVAPIPEPATPHVQSPRSNLQFVEHAEQDVINHFIEAVESRGLQAADLEGHALRMHISEPTGVCSACSQGIGRTITEPGVLLQLSNRYPGLTIVVTWIDENGTFRNLMLLGGARY